MQTQSKEVLMKEIIWTFALRSLENQIFTSGWLHPEWSEGNPVFCRGRPSFAWLSSSAVSACPLCLRRWLGNGSRGSDCGLGQFLKVSGGREKGAICFSSFCVWQRGLWEPFLLQQISNSPLVKWLSVCLAENGISAEAFWNDFRKPWPVVKCHIVPWTTYKQHQDINIGFAKHFRSHKDLQTTDVSNSIIKLYTKMKFWVFFFKLNLLP